MGERSALGVVLEHVLCAIFPPAVVVVGIGGMLLLAIYSNDEEEAIRAGAVGRLWDQQHGTAATIGIYRNSRLHAEGYAGIRANGISCRSWTLQS